MAEKVKADGIVTFAPSDKAPDWVYGTLVIDINKFIDWIKADGKQYLTDYKGQPQLKLQVTGMKDKRGMLVSVDTWKPDGAKVQQQSVKKEAAPSTTNINGIETPDDSDLPF
jgi:hypothetical protein